VKAIATIVISFFTASPPLWQRAAQSHPGESLEG
jgi:hypothetical protein